MTFGRYTIWYNHEDHVWEVYNGTKGYRYPEFTVNNYSTFLDTLRDKLGFLDTDKNHRRFWGVMRWWSKLRHGLSKSRHGRC